MDPRPVEVVAAFAQGSLDGPLRGSTVVGPDVVVDSRLVTPGSLFVALQGERVDGHDFVETARGMGAAAALVSRRVDSALPQILVDDVLTGLASLAQRIVAGERDRGLIVVGITGSAGKTSTKDLVAQVLESAGPTVAPPGSFNNEIGAPLTACRVDSRTRFLVAEMGARGVGHIATLAQITPPDVGVVLNVGSAHVGEFGSTDMIARAKGELVEAVGLDGWAVLNADDPRVLAMRERTSAQIAVFSARGDAASAGADLRVWASDVSMDALQRPSFVLHVSGERWPNDEVFVRLHLIGGYQLGNALAAAAVGLLAGLSLEQIAAALGTAVPRSRWRMELTERPDGAVILNDAYNANPEAMEAALETLGQVRRSGGRLIAVLGDMLELGDSSAEDHVRVGRRAADLGIDELVALGTFAPQLVEGFGVSAGPAREFASRDEMTQYLRGILQPDDVVLVKASRGVGLECVAQDLVDDGEGADS